MSNAASNGSGTGLILASASPRRHQLLREAGIAFEVVESGLDEKRAPGESAREFARRMAGEKAVTVSRQIPARLVLGADTVVECDGEIMGKPRDPRDARRMLTKLSGRTHTVITAFALARDGAIVERGDAVSLVTFRKLPEEEIGRYITIDEPFDKAGAYAIQGVGAGFIASVEGSRDNVMGLPTGEVAQALKRLGIKAQGDGTVG